MIELTDVVLRIIGAFYAFGGFVATRAGLMSQFLDQAIAAIALKKPTRTETAQNEDGNYAWVYGLKAHLRFSPRHILPQPLVLHTVPFESRGTVEMGKAFLRALAGLIKSYPPIIAIPVGVAGTLKLMGYDWVPLPYWAWWLVVILLLLWQLLRLQMRIDKQSDVLGAKRPPDLSLEDVLRRIVKNDSPGEASWASVNGALNEIRSYAAPESAPLTVLGVRSEHRRLFNLGQEIMPVEIEHSYWLDHKIGYNANNRGGFTERVDGRSVSANYSPLRFRSAQVDLLWPPPGRRIDWRRAVQWKNSYR